MFPLLETIKIKNNQIRNSGYHNRRIKQSIKILFGTSSDIEIEKIIKINENLDKQSVYKCRFLYGEKSWNYEFVKYQIPGIKSLRIVECDTAEYSLKKTDRSFFENLRAHKNLFDDILIVKNNRITDTSFANIVFWDGKNWITPLYPLLKGTKRQYYIDRNIILEKDIFLNDLGSFSNARIINAMIDIEESYNIDINNILL
jgi:4-amino-4-deoxychorismate lyase